MLMVVGSIPLRLQAAWISRSSTFRSPTFVSGLAAFLGYSIPPMLMKLRLQYSDGAGHGSLVIQM